MKKMTAFVIFIIVSLLAAALTGCASEAGDVFRELAGNTPSESGGVNGEIDKSYSTKWFSFRVKSVNWTDSYAGYTPEPGYILLDVLLTERCTYGVEIPLGTFDFVLDSPEFLEYAYPLPAIDDTMMPEEFYLAPNDVAEYHLIFEIPAETQSLFLVYTEVDVEGVFGETFGIELPRK